LLQSLVPHVPLFWQPPDDPVPVEQLLHPAISSILLREIALLVNVVMLFTVLQDILSNILTEIYIFPGYGTSLVIGMLEGFFYASALAGRSLSVRPLAELPPAFRSGLRQFPTTDGETIYQALDLRVGLFTPETAEAGA
jgi:hypothetical protein